MQLPSWFGVLFGLSSIITPFFLGAIAGATASGRVPPGGRRGRPDRQLVQPDIDPGGTLAVGICAYLAAAEATLVALLASLLVGAVLAVPSFALFVLSQRPRG